MDKLNHKGDYLGSIDWNATRSIYKKLSEEFHVLTDAYELTIDDRTKLMLDHLILGIDDIDQTIDNLESRTKRDKITSSIIEYLQNDEVQWKASSVTNAFIQNIQTIKYIVTELQINYRFYKAASDIFKFTEDKRHVTDSNELIQLVLAEGKATGELPLSIMKVQASHDFGVFFTNLCTLMGIADLIIDAKSDYKAKQISVKPTLSLYLKLNMIMIKEGILLIWNFPKKLSFLLYCIRFSIALIKS